MGVWCAVLYSCHLFWNRTWRMPVPGLLLPKRHLHRTHPVPLPPLSSLPWTTASRLSRSRQRRRWIGYVFTCVACTVGYWLDIYCNSLLPNFVMVGFNLIKNFGTCVRSQAFDSGKQHGEFLQVGLPPADCMQHLANAFVILAATCPDWTAGTAPCAEGAAGEREVAPWKWETERERGGGGSWES